VFAGQTISSFSPSSLLVGKLTSMRIIVNKVVLTLIDTVTIGYSTTVSDTSPTDIISSTYKFQDLGGTGAYVDFDFTAVAAGAVCFFVQSKNMWGGVQVGYLKTSAINITSPFPISFASVAPVSGAFVKNVNILTKITLNGVTLDAPNANIWYSTTDDSLGLIQLSTPSTTFAFNGTSDLTFNFTPTQPVGTNLYFYVKAIADYATQPSYIVSAPITIVTPFPISFSGNPNPATIIQLVSTQITLTLNGVTTGAPKADIYYAYGSGLSPISLYTDVAFTGGNNLVFNFTAAAGTTEVYFYVKAIETNNTRQSSYLESPRVTINAPAWVPTSADILTSNAVSPYTLIVDFPIQLTFKFNTSANFPSDKTASNLFTLTIDSFSTSLSGASIDYAARTITLSYTALSSTTTNFVFSTIYSALTYQFTVNNNKIYTFPSLVSTTPSPTYTSIGEQLTFTSIFDANLLPGMTGTISIKPATKNAVIVSPQTAISATSSISYLFTVLYDEDHSAIISLTYGTATKTYGWASESFSSTTNIYSFPSAFTCDGLTNGLDPGYILKEGQACNVTLTFTGGDMLHSSNSSLQVNSLSWTQGGIENLVTTGITCDSATEKISFGPFTPSSSFVTIKVILYGPGQRTTFTLTKNITEIVTLALSPLTIQLSAKTHLNMSITSTDFPPAFKSLMMANIPIGSGTSGLFFRRYCLVCTNSLVSTSTSGVNTCITQFPSWASTVIATSTSVSPSPKLASTISNLYNNISSMAAYAPLGSSVTTTYGDSNIPFVLMRYIWQFPAGTTKILTSLTFIMSYPGWNSEYINMEVVGSIDGVNFVRIPSMWHDGTSDTLDDTFHMKWNRKTRSGTGAWLFADNMTEITTNTSTSAGGTASYILGTANARPLIAIVSLSNNIGYRYYGLGNVGSNTPYVGTSANTRVLDPSRYYAGCPAGDGFYTSNSIAPILVTPSAHQIHSSFVLTSDLMANSIPWTANQNLTNFIIPSVNDSAGITLKTYKHWRFRAASSTLAELGEFSVYFWKLGLYRDIVTSTKDDTYGISPSNYVLQTASNISVSDGVSGVTTLSAGSSSRDRFLASKPLWTETWANTSAQTSLYLQTEAIKVTFKNETAFFQLSLDVTGEIGILRFPTNMYCDANKKGGTLIVEASTSDAPNTWIPIIATSNTQTLGRNGLFATSNSNAAGNVALTNKLFTVSPSTFVAPASLSNLVIPSTIRAGTTMNGCKIIIQAGGGGWTSSSNTIKEDFSIHCVPSSEVSPFWSGNVPFNCSVTNYNTGTGELTFSVSAFSSGSNFKFVVFVRDGQGSGVIVARLESDNFSIEEPELTINSTPQNIYTNISISIPITIIAQSSLDNISVTLYYDTTRTNVNPTQCGNGTLRGGNTSIALVLCTFLTTGTFYIYAKTPSGSLLCSTTTVTVTTGTSSINFKSFGLTSASPDVTSVTATQSSFISALPNGFSTTGTLSGFTALKSYNRDINGEWAPILTPLTIPMVRLDYNSATTSVVLNAKASGYAVILIQCNIFNTADYPSVIWSSYLPSKTAMSSSTSYVNCSVGPAASITFGPGVNSSGEVITSATQQKNVAFSNTYVSGESGRWYNGIKEPSATTSFDVSKTQTLPLGIAGGVQLQDYITIHKFNSLMPVSIDSINTIAYAPGITTMYACTVPTNRCGGARFAEFAVVTNNLQSDDLLNLANDYANRWCVPFAGPTIKKFRLVNTGSADISIGYFSFGSSSDVSVNLITNSAYNSATYAISSGSISAAGTWASSTTTTTPHQNIPSGGYLEVTLTSSIENCGFLQLGRVIFNSGARLVMDVNFTSGSWERYDLWYHYNGAAVNASLTDFSEVGSNINIYAKNSALMPWKQKYRTNTNEKSDMPYNLPLYNISRESDPSYLSTLSGNLMAMTWDADRSVKFCQGKSRTGQTFTENDFVQFKNVGATPAVSTLSSLFTTTAKSTMPQDGQYDLTNIEQTRYQYMHSSIGKQYLSYSSSALEYSGYLETANFGLVFLDPVSLQSIFTNANGSTIDYKMRIRKSLTGYYYLDSPQSFEYGKTIDGYSSTNPRRFSSPLNNALNHMFGLSVFNPLFGETIDTLEMQKKFTICSFVCNGSLLYRGHSTVNIGDTMALFGDISNLSNTSQTGLPFSVSVSNSVCTGVIMQNFGCVLIRDSSNNKPTFISSSYRALRTCTLSGTSSGEYNHPSQERLYIVTVVIDTTVAGANSFSTDSDMEKYAKIYINGKRINTSTRLVRAGSNYVTCTTNITTPGAWPSYFYPSSALTYGVSQITDTSKNGFPKYVMRAPYNSSSGKCFDRLLPANNGRPYATERTSLFQGGNRTIVLETKTEHRKTSVYTTEVDTHIKNLSTKWGIVMAYRWVTIKNTGSVDFRFSRLGFYGSHTEAYSDSTGIFKDAKSFSYSNIMKGIDNIIYLASTGTTVGKDGLESVLSNTIDEISVSVDETYVNIPAGGWISFDLTDSITCSHVRFGKFSSTGDVTQTKFVFELTQTIPEGETQGEVVSHVLKASLNNSGVEHGQFPLFSPAKSTDVVGAIVSGGAHANTCGVYVLVPPSSYTTITQTFPSGVSITSPSSAIILSSNTITLTLSGQNNEIQSAYVYQSASSTDTNPAQIGLKPYLLSGNNLVFTFTPSIISPQIYFFVKGVANNGNVQTSYIKTGKLDIVNSFPTSITAISPTTNFIQNGLTNVTLTLANVLPGTTKAQVYWATSDNFGTSTQIGTDYNFVENNLSFLFTPGLISSLFFFVKGIGLINNELQSSTLSTGTIGQCTVDNTSLPTSISDILPIIITEDIPTSVTLKVAGVVSTLKANVYQGPDNNFANSTIVASSLSFTGTTLTFPFTAFKSGTLFFFVRGDSAADNTAVFKSVTVVGFPTSITSVTSEPDLAQGEVSVVTINITNVNNSPKANIYWSETNNFSSALLIGPPVTFVSNKLVFSFTPLAVDNVFFFVRALTADNIEQSTPIVSLIQGVETQTLKSIYKIDSMLASTGILNNDPFASSIILCYPGNTSAELSNTLNSFTPTKTIGAITGTMFDNDSSMFYGIGTSLKSGGQLMFKGLNLSNNFTVECWLKFSDDVSLGGYGVGGDVFSTRPNGFDGVAGTNSISAGLAWTQVTPISGGRYLLGLPLKTGIRRMGVTAPVDTSVSGTTITSGLSRDSFIHFALTYTSSIKTYKLYINGVLNLTSTWTDTITGTELWFSPAYIYNDIRAYTTVKYTGNFNLLQNVNNPYPIGIKTVSYSTPFVKNGSNNVTITFIGTTENTQYANIYQGTTSGMTTPTFINKYQINENMVTFPYTPLVNTVYFYIKPIFGNIEQSSFFETSAQSVITPYPTSITNVSQFTFIEGVQSQVILTLAGVTNGTSSAYIYQHSTPGQTGPSLSQIGGVVNFVNNTLTFNFTPSTSGSVYFYVGAISGGVTASPLIYSSGFVVYNPFPTSISYVACSPPLQVGIQSYIKISLNNVNSFLTPNATIYHSATSGSSSPNSITTTNFTGSILTFLFTPTYSMLGSLYFYIKCITSSSVLQSSFLVSIQQNVLASMTPVVSFTSTVASSFSLENGNQILEWRQNWSGGVTSSSSIIMLPIAQTGNSNYESYPAVSLVNNIFNNKPGILTSSLAGIKYCLYTSDKVPFGGAADISLTYTMYLLCRPFLQSSVAGYIGGYGFNYDQVPLTKVSSQFGRNVGGTTYGNTLNTTAGTTELFKPGSSTYPYPDTTSGFEIWCFCKKGVTGSPGMEIYQNNVSFNSSQSGQTGPAYQLENYWRIGCGSGYTGTAGGPSYIGAFRVYNTYHDSSSRAAVQLELESLFATYTPPTSFKFTPQSGYFDSIITEMSIEVNVINSVSVPIKIYYASSPGISTLGGLTECGSGMLVNGKSKLGVVIPSGTMYIYIIITSPEGVVGSILGASTPIVSFSVPAYTHASGASYTPVTIVENTLSSVSVTLSGYDTVTQGTAEIYYSLTNNDGNPTVLGNAVPTYGVVTVIGSIPIGIYYVYARTISPTLVKGPLRLCSQKLTSRSYTFPTSFTCTPYPSSTSCISYFLFSPADQVASSNVNIYYSTNNSSTNLTVCGTGTINALGVLSLVLNLPTFLTTFYIYAMITESPSGIGSLLLYNSQFNISNFTTSYTTIQTFAKSNTSSLSDFSSNFKNVLLANIDAGTTWKRFHAVYTDTNIPFLTGTSPVPQIPTWQTTITGTPVNTVNIKTSLVTTSTTGLTPFGSGIPGLVYPSGIPGGDAPQYHCRYYWDFQTAKILTSFILYTSYPGWNTEWTKMEIVGSNDGINFIRIPTEWSVTGASPGANTVEDVFHVKYNRRSKGGSYAWVFADNFDTVSTVTASTNISSPWYMLTEPSSRPMLCTINVVNATAYRYYGLGAVGSGTPYYTSDRVTTFTTYSRYYARHPYSHSYFCDHKQTGFTPSNWQTTSAVLPSEMMLTVMPWIVNQGYVNYMIPQVLPSNVVSTPIITYKYWRFRATSGFLGAFGNDTTAWFWKLGLFRDITTANEDTYGTYSTNYIQQWGNSLYNNSSTETIKGNFGRDALFCSKPDWTDTAYTRYTKSNIAENEMPFVTFTNDSAYITIKLDVTGTIGALRFPSYMYCNVRGGAFILEVSNTGATGSWTTMVATCGTAILGREGTMPIVAGTHGANAILTNRIFSITPATNLYSWPTSLGIPVITGDTLKYYDVTACTIKIIGGNTSTNTKDDFNVHLVRSDTPFPYWTPGSTIFNCDVTSYNPQTSILSFNSNPSIRGDAFFVVFIRSGEGTGLLGTTENPNAGILISKTFYAAQVGDTVTPKIWLDGSNPLNGPIPSNNQDIPTWLDLIGGNNAVRSNPSVPAAKFVTSPTGVTTGLGCISSGSNDYGFTGLVMKFISPYYVVTSPPAPASSGYLHVSKHYTMSLLAWNSGDGNGIGKYIVTSGGLNIQAGEANASGLDGNALFINNNGNYSGVNSNYTLTSSLQKYSCTSKWVHICVTYAGANPLKIYVNGVPMNSYAFGTGDPYWGTTAAPPYMQFGGRIGDWRNRCKDYLIADFRYYEGVLSSTEVAALTLLLKNKFGVTLDTPV
jgi:hypothetical protein